MGKFKGDKRKTRSFKPVILKYAAAPKCEPEYFKETSNIFKMTFLKVVSWKTFKKFAQNLQTPTQFSF